MLTGSSSGDHRKAEKQVRNQQSRAWKDPFLSATKRKGHGPAFSPAVCVEQDISICTGCRTSAMHLYQAEEHLTEN